VINEGVAVIIPGKLVYLATPHTGSIATTVALSELPGALASVIGHGMTIVGERDEALPKVPHHSTMDELREIARDRLTGTEVSVTAIRNPYDLLVTCWLRQWARLKLNLRAYLQLLIDDEDRAGMGVYVRDGRLFWMNADRYMHYENLQEELSSLLHELGLENVELPRKNVTPEKQPWWTYYDVESRKFAEEKFGGEAASFGYSFTEAAAAS
jgi:hypothetical protein